MHDHREQTRESRRNRDRIEQEVENSPPKNKRLPISYVLGDDDSDSDQRDMPVGREPLPK